MSPWFWLGLDFLISLVVGFVLACGDQEKSCAELQVEAIPAIFHLKPRLLPADH